MNKRFFIVLDSVKAPTSNYKLASFISIVPYVGMVRFNGRDVNCNGTITMVILEDGDDEEVPEYPFNTFYRSFVEMYEGSVAEISIPFGNSYIYAIIDGRLLCGREAILASYKKALNGEYLSEGLKNLAIEHANSLANYSLITSLKKC